MRSPAGSGTGRDSVLVVDPSSTSPRPRGITTTAATVAALGGIALALTAAFVAPSVLDADATGTGRTAGPTDDPVVGPAPSGAVDPDPTTRGADVRAALDALPGVASAVVTPSSSGLSAELELAAPLPGPGAAQRTADDARDLLEGQGRWQLLVTGTSAGTSAGTAALEVYATSDDGPGLLGTDPVAHAVRLVGHDGVRSVVLTAERADVEVATAPDLLPVAGLVRDDGRGLTSIVVTGYGAGSFDGDGTSVPDDAVLRLVADVAARATVTQVAHEARRSGVPSGPLLTVVSTADPATLARWLAATGYDGPPLAYQVQGIADDGASATRSGTLPGASGAAAGAPAGACAAADLSVTAGGFDAALGRRFLTLTARNDTAGACVLSGPPGVRFVASDGAETDILLEPDTATGPDGGGPVELSPGGTATATLTWRGGSTAGDPPRVTSLLVAPHGSGADGGDVVVPLAGTEGATEGLDLLDGGSAQIGAWTTTPG
nr:DUF4232 domain-containing protein [Cellulosimicrobium arenosum]